MKWEDFKGNEPANFPPAWILTDIECPECGAKIFQRVNEVIATNPPKHKFKCDRCGWTGAK